MSTYRPISRDEEWCRACKHWAADGEDRVKADHGQCRRHAPTPYEVQGRPRLSDKFADWPNTRAADYCGEFTWDTSIDEWIDDPEFNPKD
jgi:hypothetical protein